MSGFYVRAAMPSDVDGVAAIHVAGWRETYTGLIPDEVLTLHSVENRAEMWRRSLERGVSRLFVAEEDGEIVGFANVGPSRYTELPFTHELYAIYALARVHGRGIGKALTLAGVEALIGMGAQSMVLWVLETNEVGRRFYDGIGGAVVGERDEEMAGQTLKEVAYGWPDIHTLHVRLGGAPASSQE